MPFCGECGTKLEPGVKFCGECGAKADSGSAPAPAPAPQKVEVQQVEVKEVASAPAPAKLEAGEELVYTPAQKGGDFASPAMNRLLGDIPDILPDFSNYVKDDSYAIKPANKGITKHVTLKLWNANIVDKSGGFEINKVYQYLAPIAQQEAYHKYFSEMEAQGFHLQNASKRLETQQAWYAPDSKEKLEKILKEGFKNINTLAFTKCPIKCCKEATGGQNTLIQCRVLLARHRDEFGKIFIQKAEGVLIGFIVEYTKA
mmetsp:Transcript_4064/g.7851  ORF Transcript_4064/g.7851 Transcript_4064/m.7851 type:complete len:258 (-) Transcript_4064:211-984(-)|eukprot:CAMPEP_0175146440 /NCGR_PEP_ID=MMETSP0087-20121206/15383_1 /TAXON_ID=136419 /ORGANISM="Unknown Unknown, Strain D1" /LENGTH=257 /DNA_ID=CAMNT_0016431409 /DNA_START=32 /DNA_END=805 /DNA_ORIENTATION=+